MNVQENLADSKSQCELVIKHHFEYFRIDFLGEQVLRIIDYANFIKLEAFTPKYEESIDRVKCTGFRIKIQVEPIWEMKGNKNEIQK